MKLRMHFHIATTTKAHPIFSEGRQVVPALVRQIKVNTRQDHLPVGHERHTAKHAGHCLGGRRNANGNNWNRIHILRQTLLERRK